ncbi:hypothetical protein P9112_010660 [Eukaryota sp. TZLM1-RC]
MKGSVIVIVSYCHVITRLVLVLVIIIHSFISLSYTDAKSHHRPSLNPSPYHLIFGTETPPRLLPHSILDRFCSIHLDPDTADSFLGLCDLCFQENAAVYSPKIRLQVNDRVFVLWEKPDKLHGHYVGPYTVQAVLSSSSVLLLNPVTRSKLKTSIHLIISCHSSLPQSVLDAYAAADSGETFLDAILGIESDIATVLWSDDTTTKQPVVISDCLFNLFEEFELTKNFLGITTDNGANVVASVQLLSDRLRDLGIVIAPRRCSTHILNLAVKWGQGTCQSGNDPLTYWKSNTLRFLLLPRLAKNYLNVQATSVCCEQVFSPAGRTVTEFRASLSDNSVQALISLQDWRRFFQVDF